MHLYEVLRRPLVTEKSAALQALGKYSFIVASDANKKQVKEAVEKAFKVSVTTVNISMTHGKSRRIGRQYVTSSPEKKAIVTLAPGDKIELFEGV